MWKKSLIYTMQKIKEQLWRERGKEKYDKLKKSNLIEIISL